MYSRGRMTIDPRISPMLGQSTSNFHRSGRHRVRPARGGRGGGQLMSWEGGRVGGEWSWLPKGMMD